MGYTPIEAGESSRARGAVRDFRELKVWQKAHRFVLAIYRQTRGFPAEERFGLTSQLRRAAASVASNIQQHLGSLVLRQDRLDVRWEGRRAERLGGL